MKYRVRPASRKLESSDGSLSGAAFLSLAATRGARRSKGEELQERYRDSSLVLRALFLIRVVCDA